MAGEVDIITALMNVMNSGRGAASGQVTQSGGSTTTQSGGGGTSSVSSYTSPGDISALQALLGELGGADYQGVLNPSSLKLAARFPASWLHSATRWVRALAATAPSTQCCNVC